jgi:hypothetical protein
MWRCQALNGLALTLYFYSRNVHFPQIPGRKFFFDAFTRVDNLQPATYQRLHEMGRIMKIIFLCEFLSNSRLHKEIQKAFNVIEQMSSKGAYF